MTQRVVEKPCTKKVCVSFLAPARTLSGANSEGPNLEKNVLASMLERFMHLALNAYSRLKFTSLTL